MYQKLNPHYHLFSITLLLSNPLFLFAASYFFDGYPSILRKLVNDSSLQYKGDSMEATGYLGMFAFLHLIQTDSQCIGINLFDLKGEGNFQNNLS